MKFYLTLSFILCQLVSIGQVIQKGGVIELQLRDVRMKLEKTTPIAGHLYLDETVKSTTIDLKEGLNIEKMMARLNLKDDIMELHIDDYILVLKGESIKSFSQDGDVFLRGSELDEFRAKDHAFYKVMFDGNYKLYSHERVLLKAGNYNEALGVGEKQDQYVKDQTFFLVKNGEVLLESASPKKIFKFLINEKNPIKEYAKNNKVKPSSYGVIKLLNYADTI